MQALESLNDNQVNDFLSGKTPLNLSMRLGDHMMLIQLQLSTVTPTSPATRTKHSSKSKLGSSSSTSAPSSSFSTNTRSTSPNLRQLSSPLVMDETIMMATRSRSNSIDVDSNSYLSNTNDDATTSSMDATTSTLQQQAGPTRQRDLVLISKEFENLKHIVNSLSTIQHSENVNYTNDSHLLEQSPIKSLSNLVSSPIKTTPIKNIPSFTTPPSKISGGGESGTDPLTAKFTSCICKRLNTGCETQCCHNNREQDELSAQSSQNSSPSTSAQAYGGVSNASSPSTSSPCATPTVSPTSSTSSLSSAMKSLQSALLHRTTNNPITKKRYYTSNSMRRSKSSDNIRIPNERINNTASTSSSLTNSPDSGNITSDSDTMSSSSSTPTGTLAEASRSLTQTLRKLSKEVFTNKVDTLEDSQRKNAIGSGAVIESMKNHGKGIYSGTFSGTLNPALQDRNGRPKRDISTVIHILNDLLSATPHYTRGARICFEPTRSIKQVRKYFYFFLVETKKKISKFLLEN